MKCFIITACVLGLLSSCTKDNASPKVEEIKKGSKWGIEIGKSAATIYGQLQKLSTEKKFNEVEPVGIQTFNSLEEVGERIFLYSGITLENKNNVYTDRIIIQFNADSIAGIMVGGSIPDIVSRWPENIPEEKAIASGEKLADTYSRLSAIYATGMLDDYTLRLGFKSLDKPFDNALSGFERWHFVFFENGGRNRSTVDLYFQEGVLKKIVHESAEFELYY